MVKISISLATMTTVGLVLGLLPGSAVSQEPTANDSAVKAATAARPPVGPILYVPGASIPSAATIGRGQIGREADYRSIVMGTADVFGKGPYDLFLLPNRLFPFQEFDAQGVPVYGQPIVTQGQGMNGAVIPGPGTDILGVFAEGKRVRICKFDRASLAFVPFALSNELELPGDIGVGITGHIDRSGAFNAYFSVSDGVVYRPVGPSAITPSLIPIPFHHTPQYLPYDGAGFWRGGIHRRMLYHARFDNLELKQVEKVSRASTGPGEFLFEQYGLALAQLGAEQPLALVSSEHLGNMRRFQIDATTGAIGEQQLINNESHVALRHVAITASLRAIPDPQSGLTNFLVGDTARIWFYRSSGKFSPNGSPILLPPQPVMSEKAPLRLGELPVISPGDMDADGQIDFMVGNDAGQLLFVKNSGRAGRPEFDNPIAVSVGGRPLNIKAGYRGSVQGPAEAMWGYTCPTVCDWNGDGRLDVVLNSVLADYMVLLQVPAEKGVPAFTEPQLLYCDGLQLHLAWRSQPGITDWGTKGKLCMIALDEQNLLRQFWRIDDQNVQRGELLRLTTGATINANIDEAAGQTGRAKIVPCDWDGDGRIDLLLGTSRGLSFPAGENLYYPSHFYPNHKASVLLLRNTGSNAQPVFEYVRLMQFEGQRIGLGIHSCSPAVVDFGTGVADLFVSEEHGTIRYYPRPSLSLSTTGK
ncbi:MAG: VCBS repeat-containing protein [Planctomycetota bacterium]